MIQSRDQGKGELQAELMRLRKENARLKSEQADPELLRETSIQHPGSDAEEGLVRLRPTQEELSSRIGSLRTEVSRLRLQLEKVRHDKADLELMLEMVTAHSDELAEGLFSKVDAMLRESEKRFRVISEAIPVAIAVSRVSDDVIVYGNESASLLLGLPAWKLPGRKMMDFYDPSDRQQLLDRLASQSRVKDFAIRGRKADGSSFGAMLHIEPLTFNNEECLLSTLHDTTDRQQAERERMRLITAIEQCAEAIIITDSRWVVQYVNPAFERISGYARAEIFGRRLSILKSDQHSESFYKEIRQTLRQGDIWTGHLFNKKKDGHWYEAEVSATPIRDGSDAIINFVFIHRDVTHEAKLERQLQQAQKLEAIGTLAGGIAHDFNNILMAIMGFTEIALCKVGHQDEVKVDLEQALQACNRAKDLISQILTFCRRGEQERKPVLVSYIVREALKLLRASLPSTIEIRERISGEALIVLADPTQIYQLVMNLCNNAFHAMRTQEAGRLEVGMEKVLIDPLSRPDVPEIEDGEYVRIKVSDTGHGMSPEILERIFDPYFTTKEKDEGTGLGLAVVRGIVMSMGGMVTVYSKPGSGAAFNVYLPLADQCLPEKTAGITPLPTGHEHILLVDDEKIVVDMATAMLESLGYEVNGQTSSLEALELFRSRPDRYDLVITDLTMPRMTGKTLAQELLKIRPDIPIIMCTGYSRSITKEMMKLLNIREFILKPVMMRDLALVLRQVLEAS